MSMIIAWNFNDYNLLASDHRHTVYNMDSQPTGKYQDVPGSKIKMIGNKYAYSMGGLSIPCGFVENGLNKIDENIPIPELLNKITELCQAAHEKFISSEYGHLELQGFRAITLFLASYDQHWVFDGDNNFKPKKRDKDTYNNISVVSVDDNDAVFDAVKKFAKTCKSPVEVLINTFRTIARGASEISPECDIYLISKNRGVQRLMTIQNPIQNTLQNLLPESVFSRIIRTSGGDSRVQMDGTTLSAYVGGIEKFTIDYLKFLNSVSLSWSGGSYIVEDSGNLKVYADEEHDLYLRGSTVYVNNSEVITKNNITEYGYATEGYVGSAIDSTEGWVANNFATQSWVLALPRATPSMIDDKIAAHVAQYHNP